MHASLSHARSVTDDGREERQAGRQGGQVPPIHLMGAPQRRRKTTSPFCLQMLRVMAVSEANVLPWNIFVSYILRVIGSERVRVKWSEAGRAVHSLPVSHHYPPKGVTRKGMCAGVCTVTRKRAGEGGLSNT